MPRWLVDRGQEVLHADAGARRRVRRRLSVRADHLPGADAAAADQMIDMALGQWSRPGCITPPAMARPRRCWPRS